MGNIPKKTVICQCLEMLNVDKSRNKILDYRTQKLLTGSSILLFVEAQLQQRNSYANIAEHLTSNPELQKFLDLESISAAQLSRKMQKLPLEQLQLIFFSVIKQIQSLTKNKRGVSPGIGKLKILDSTEIRMPPILSKWAYCSKTNHGVKMHTSLVVADAKTMYPEKIIASTVDVADHEVATEFTVDKDATYVMDRGYPVYAHVQYWVNNKFKFVARVKAKSRLAVIKEFELPKRKKNITRDAIVKLPNLPTEVRLIEFVDDQNQTYRIITNRYDLSALQIAEIYRNRWHIELFFKWIKQHIRLVKPHGYTQEAIWNQMYIALIAYACCLLVKLTLQSAKTIWKILELIRIYADRSWDKMLEALHRKPKRTSNGKPKRTGRPPTVPRKSMKPKIIVR